MIRCMKKVIGVVMAILIILFVICNIIFFNIFGNNKYDLRNISDSQKKEIIELLNCTEILNDIDLKELQIPKTYRDIYYQVYWVNDGFYKFGCQEYQTK